MSIEQDEQDRKEGPWVVARVRCCACTYESVSVHPVQADENSLECPQCGFCDSEVIEEDSEAE